MNGVKRLSLVLIFFGVLTLFAFSIQPVSAAPTAQTNGRTVQFAGQEWYVKAGTNLGPGPNNFSDDSQSVWVDNNGYLHLKIRYANGVWNSAEVYAVNPASYGLYRFYTATPLNALDLNVVLGLFLYQTTDKEIDFEASSWS